MANLRISELTDAFPASLENGDLLPVARGGETRKLRGENIRNSILGIIPTNLTNLTTRVNNLSSLTTSTINLNFNSNLYSLSANVINSSIDTIHLRDSGVTTDKIANLNVTPGKLSTGGPSWNTSGDVTVQRSLIVNRQDLNQEGGEIRLARASDNTTTWGLDSFGSGSTPQLRIFDAQAVRFTINGSDGFVGIGANTQPDSLLTIGDSYPAGNGPYLTLRNTSNNSTNAFGPSVRFFTGRAGETPIILGTRQNDSRFYIAQAVSPFTEFFTINSSGNIGIGTTDPQANLEVTAAGNSTIGVSSNLTNNTGAGSIGFLSNRGDYNRPRGQISVFGTNSTNDYQLLRAGNFTIYSAWADLCLNADTGNNIRMFTTGTGEVMRITGSGNILTGGLTTSPGQADSNSTSGGILALNTKRELRWFNTNASIYGGSGGLDDNLYYYSGLSHIFRSNNQERMRITSSGDVLIGTNFNHFGGKALIQNNGPTNLDLYATTLTDIAKVRFYNNQANCAIGGQGGDLIFYATTVDQEAMRINALKNVSIGTPLGTGGAPAVKLHVQGSSLVGASPAINISQFSGIRIEGDAVNRFPTTGTTLGENGLSFIDGNGGGAAITARRGGSWDTSLHFYTNPSTNATTGAITERLRIDSNGVIGIGGSAGMFTSPWSGTSTIQMGATSISNQAYINGSTVIATNGYFTSGDGITPAWRYTNPSGFNAGGSLYAQGYITGYHIWYTAPPGNNGAEMPWQERMRIDSNGNVGIGTNGPDTLLHINGASNTTQTWNGGTNFIKLVANGPWSEQCIAFQEVANDVGAKIGVKNEANGAYGIVFANRPNTSTTSTLVERMRINNIGSVGIGTSLPARRLHIASPLAAEMIIEQTDALADNRRWNFVADAGNSTTASNFYLRKLNDGVGTGGYAAWSINGTSGNMVVGASVVTGGVNFNAGRLAVKQGAENYETGGISVIGSNTNNRWTLLAATNGHLYFGYNAADRAYILNNTGGYNTVSDSRLKKNITNCTYGLKDVEKLRPVEYNMKDERDTSKKHLGFIAQEVKEVIDNVVTNASTSSNEEMYFIDKSELVPVLVKAIQELKTELDSVKQELQALKD